MMKGQIAGLMRQAQQMQENMKKAQDALADIQVEGASGGGLVKVTMTCRHDVKRVVIDPSLLAARNETAFLISFYGKLDIRAAAATRFSRRLKATSWCGRAHRTTDGLPFAST
jgi:DNA-binding YbaB/EbfC family protein